MLESDREALKELLVVSELDFVDRLAALAFADLRRFGRAGITIAPDLFARTRFPLIKK